MIFSIIIAAYNVAPYIKKTIDSCLNQVGICKNEYEIIVIDDGAKDDTGIIIDKYQEESNVRIVHQQNSGLSETRNKGVEIANGEFILYLDGDDWLLSDALSSLKGKINEADLIVFPMTYWYPNGDMRVKSYGLKEDFIYTSMEFLKETIGHQKLNIIPAPCKCYRRSILLEYKQKFIPGILHEDNPYFADTVKNFHKIVYIDKGLYIYRQQREGSITNFQSIRNFNGVVEGNKHILNIWGCTNKYINYMVSCTNVFQVILKYNHFEDVNVVISHYRSIAEKWIAIKQLLNYPYIPKAIIRHLLFLIDPWLLLKFITLFKKR